jgi:hypothetical protein
LQLKFKIITMKTNSRIAVFLDHSKARLITCDNSHAEFRELIESTWESHPRIRGEGSNQARFGTNPYYGSNNEYSLNMQKQELKRMYFKEIKARLLAYNQILLFGGGPAKREMLHFLGEDHSFKNKSIYIENADYLTDNQLLETVRNYFLNK